MDSQPPTLDSSGSSGGGISNPPIPGPVIDLEDIRTAVQDFFGGSGSGDVFGGFFTFMQVALAFFSLFFMLAIIYVVIQRNRVLSKDSKLYHMPKNDEEKEDETESRPKFANVLKHVDADNPSEWKIAIIESDNILYEVMRRAGYPGDTLGEMLTNASPSTFRTIESAWEAHKIRNKITHEGSDVDLSQREAKRVVDLYEKVFREFQYL